jgi:acetylornithine deacetylase/succinyl-diaminopimelate desuccinylase-like protein
MSAASEYIDANFDKTLDTLTRWCSQPSISTEGVGVAEMAVFAAQELRNYGYQVNVYETEGYPVLVGTAGPPGAPTVLIYDHYDVQPVGELAEWTSPPFEPQIRDGHLYGRGVADTKSNIVSRLDAIAAVKAVRGDLPVRIIWLLEGEEEIGSPHLDAFINSHKDELQADGCIWEFGGYTWDGIPNITLGLKGMLSVELIARGANRDLHSAMAAFVVSPVWRLVWALGAIKTPDSRVQIPGFYSDVSVPTPDQEELLVTMPDETLQDLESLGMDAFLNDMKGMEVYRASAFQPTANILGIEAGYNGPGTKTVLPREARAKLDIRLVPDQDPEAILQSLQAFLRERGFHDVEARRISNEGDLYPAISDPSSHFIRLVRQACREVSGKEPVITPSSAGSGPMAAFTRPRPGGLGLPTAAIGTGYPDSRAHGPDENIRLEDMRAHMHTMSRLLELMAEESAGLE